jgi:hypothetical protein
MIDSFAAGASARVTGRTPGASDPAPQVDLWDTTQRGNVQCQLPHGTEVVVTASARLGDGTWMYEVDGKTCKGWVPATSLEAPTAELAK